MNPTNHESACRKLLHFVADDLAILDQYSERNPVDLAREIRGAIATKDRRIAELEAALKRVCADYQLAIDEMARHGVYASADATAYFTAAYPALDVALVQAKREAIGRCIDIAKGCEDYGGGYEGEHLDAYHHGMQTVQRCLTELRDGGASYQLAIVEKLGRMAREVEP